MRLTFSGGAYEVGASCILLHIDNKNILLDCGIRQSSGKDALPDFRIIQEAGGVDAVIISHAHTDHTGALPIISKEYPFAKIYMNTMTKDLVKVLLYDSLKIMNNREAEIPLYVENDVLNMLDRVHTINYSVDFQIFEDMKVTFYPAGHIAGACCVYITSMEGSFFYSGDFTLFAQRTIEGAKLPKLRPDAAIFEATYGDKLHSNREVEEERLLGFAESCISNGGKLLIPAFALGRAQEIILILKRAMNNNRLKKVKVYVDGMVKDVNAVYKRNPLYLKSSLAKKILKGSEPFYDENIIPVDSKETRERIITDTESCIIVASSGMLTGGPSQYYAEVLVGMENGSIVISGYQDEEAPGRRLLDLMDSEEKVFTVNGRTLPVKCHIDKVGLSAHGDKSEIKAVIESLSPKNIFLVHGECSVIDSLGRELAENYIGRVYTPKTGETIDVVIRNPRKQLIKSLAHKLIEKEALSEENLEKLWEYVSEKYGDKFFTVEELLLIWHGSTEFTEEQLENAQKLLLNSIYFENDSRRFFMFKARAREVVEVSLRPKEYKQNELSDIITRDFSEFNYKKISYIIDAKTVILNFDFPKTVPVSINEKIYSFKALTSWDIQINAQTNLTALDNELKMVLGFNNVKKISHNINDSTVLVQLNNIEGNYIDEKETFKARTGFEFIIKNMISENSVVNSEMVFDGSGRTAMEQNAAISHIDENFKYEEFRPYKKSIKAKGFMELCFISPMVGKRYSHKLALLASETGWRLSISPAVNQNEVISTAARLCTEENIILQKNPSFNPATLEVTVKAGIAPESKLGEIQDAFKQITGCELIFS